MMNDECMDLVSLQTIIEAALAETFPSPLWVRAEISAISVKRGGHCYMELSQSKDGNVVAKVRAVIWSSVYRQIEPAFSSVTGVSLDVGQQVLLRVNVQYTALYGLSLIVDDIDPQYTLGDAQKKRAETLERLSKEGLLDLQKEFALPALPYRIAVISAKEAAGYRDFYRHLHENAYGYRFRTELFEAPMQGNECPAGIAASLKSLAGSGEKYDAVVILRGGGSKLDLAWYDEYVMCEAIAHHPFPVITAVGHDQDVHLCDMVAFDAVKTPTALADYFLDIYSDEDARLESLRLRLKNAAKTRFAIMEGRLNVLRARLDAANPAKLLEKGFVMVIGPDDKPLRSVDAVKDGDSLTIMLKDGVIKAGVSAVEKRIEEI